MTDYQKRVIEEKNNLEDKAKKLSDFIGNSPIFKKIAPFEQELMKEQCEIMWEYYEILGKRISAFKPTCERCFGQGEIAGPDMKLYNCPDCSGEIS